MKLLTKTATCEHDAIFSEYEDSMKANLVFTCDWDEGLGAFTVTVESPWHDLTASGPTAASALASALQEWDVALKTGDW